MNLAITTHVPSTEKTVRDDLPPILEHESNSNLPILIKFAKFCIVFRDTFILSWPSFLTVHLRMQCAVMFVPQAVEDTLFQVYQLTFLPVWQQCPEPSSK